jgi:hypothetical protein
MFDARALAARWLRPPLAGGLVAAVVLAAGAFGTGVLAAGPAGAAELVMFRAPGCSWCAAWDREVGDAYPKSPEARVAPLREVQLNRDPDGGLALDRRVRYTPTFVLAHEGVEIGRIEGYPGEHFFWGRLDELLQRFDPDWRNRTSSSGDPRADAGTDVRTN